MNRRTFLSCLTAMLVLAFGLVIADTATAQINPCLCRTVPIRVDAGACQVQIRVTRPGETPFILLLDPDNAVSVFCADGITFELLITGGCWVNIGTNCNTGYSVPGGCCVNACLNQSPAGGCWQLSIRPHNGLCLACGHLID